MPSQKPYRILLVEDDSTTVAMYSTALAHSSSTAIAADQRYRLDSYTTAEDAVDAVKRSLEENRPFALAFIDIVLDSDRDGVWAAERIRMLDSRIEIVIVTGHPDFDPDDLAYRVPPPHKLLYVQKPLLPQEIIRFASTLTAKWRTELEVRELYSRMDARIEERTQELIQKNEELSREIDERVRTEKILHEHREQLRKALEDLRNALGGVIQVITSTVETRDPYTAGHQARVADLARTIATEMGLSKEQIEGIRIASAVHDLGKISIPAEILSKPGRLTEKEFSLITDHSQIGFTLLEPINFKWPVAELVYQHHEKINGSGYPRGLKNGEIRDEAKIITVADVVEAMASHRPYRPALGIQSALEEININRGILYDPRVVDSCLKVFQEDGYRFR